MGECIDRVVEPDVKTQQRGQRREEILDIELADEARSQRRDPVIAPDPDFETVRRRRVRWPRTVA